MSELEAYSDADHAGDPVNRASTFGVILKYGGGPIIFLSRKQPCIAQSSTESEYIAANEAARELMWVRQLFDELEEKIDCPTLYIDNLSTIKQIKNCDTKRKSKHVELDTTIYASYM